MLLEELQGLLEGQKRAVLQEQPLEERRHLRSAGAATLGGGDQRRARLQRQQRKGRDRKKETTKWRQQPSRWPATGQNRGCSGVRLRHEQP